jgi:phage terminase large subunit-like protein
MICISTAGASAGGTSVCWQEYEYGMKILDGIVQDDEVMPFFCTLDPADSWKDSSVWVKSNPALGHLFDLETIEKEFAEAMGKPSAIADFKRYALNIFSAESAEPAISIEAWDKCCSVLPSKHPNAITLRAEAIIRLQGRQCFGGVDLAPKLDTSALILLFPPRDSTERWEILEYFWIPGDNIKDRVQRDRVQYDVWRDSGFLTTTPGNLTDPRFISDSIVELSNYFDIREIAYDAAWSSELIRMLSEANFPMNKFVDYPQTHMRMNVPCQEFMRKVLRQEFVHSLNPIMRWQTSNLRWNTQKGTGFIRPDRDRKREKIDGPASLMMALARATHPDNKPKSAFWVVTSA